LWGRFDGAWVEKNAAKNIVTMALFGMVEWTRGLLRGFDQAETGCRGSAAFYKQARLRRTGPGKKYYSAITFSFVLTLSVFFNSYPFFWANFRSWMPAEKERLLMMKQNEVSENFVGDTITSKVVHSIETNFRLKSRHYVIASL
jgi:hypothetical protein